MNDAIDFSTLRWVKTELDESLKQGRQALEAYVGNPSDAGPLDALEACMHQVYGTLQMVEIYGAAMLADEMEHLVRAFKADKIRQRDDAYEVLMRSMLQLPDYLDRLAAGYRDVPIVLLPLLNDLRALRGEHLLSESRLFAPDLSAELPAGARRLADSPDALRAVKDLRHRFQVGLLGVFRDQNVAFALNTLGEVAESMVAYATSDAMARAWWIATGVIAGLKDDTLQTNASIKLLLGKLDRCLRNIIDEDRSAISRVEIDELSQNLLFYIGQSGSDDARVVEVRDAFRLADVMPGQEDVAAAKESLAGSNTDLFRTVAGVLKEELARVKESLDNVIRDGAGGTATELPSIAESLRAMSDTLGMLGMGGQRKAIMDKAAALEDAVDAGGAPEESFLMDIAGTLILVESALDGMAQGRRVVEPAEGVDAEAAMARSEYDQVRDVVLNEAIVDLARGKEAFVSFTKEADKSLLDETTQMFGQVKGSLLLLGEQRAASVMGAVLVYIKKDIEPGADAPGGRALDLLADAICGVEYYVEGLRERRVFSESAMDKAEQSLTELGVQPVAAVEAPASTERAGDAYPDVATADDLASEPAVEPAGEAPAAAPIASFELEAGEDSAEFTFELLDEDSLSDVESDEAHEAAPEPAMETIAETADEVADVAVESHGGPMDFDAEMAGLSIIGDDNDEEIVEIFIEEAEEEIASIGESLPAWINDPADRDPLSTLRRSFHTLKGSGRLVGAKRIGEFAWSFENMLNRVIDGTLEPTPVVFDLLEKARQTLPVLVAQIKDRTPLTLPAPRLMAAADAVVAGEPVPDYWIDAVVGAAPADVAEPARQDEPRFEAHDEDEPHYEPHYETEAEPDAELEAEPEAELEADREAAFEPAPFDVDATVPPETLELPVDVDFGDDAAVPEHLESADLTDEAGDEAHVEPVSEAPVFEDAAAEPAPEPEPVEAEGLMDPVLYEIFNAESLMHLGTIDRVLNSGDFSVSNDLVRALHTLHGSANMASVTPLAEVAGALERYFRVLADTARPMSDDGFDMLLVGQSMMRQILEALPARIDEPAGLGDFIARAHEAQQTLVAAPAQEPDLSIELESEDRAFEAPLDEAVADAVGEPDEESGPTEAMQAEEAQAEPEPQPVPEPMAVADDSYAGFDDELLQIFVEESAEIIERSDEALADWSRDRGDLGSLERLQRELHTLKGGARMADLTPIADLTHALETLVNAVAENGVASVDAAMERCVAAHDMLVQQLERVRTRAPLTDVAGLIAELEAVERRSADTTAEQAPPVGQSAEAMPVSAAADEGPDAELTQIFIEEANDVLEQSESALQAWKYAPEDKGLIAALQRNLHTLKGGARMAGIMAIGDLSHAMESLIVDLAEEKTATSDAVFHALEGALDRLVAMVGALASGQTPEPAEDLRHQLDLLRNEQAAPAAKAEAPAETRKQQAAPKEKARADSFPQVERRSQVRESHELVRVRADLLDSLVNNAGEVSIYRARIEQQVGALRFNLMEMDQTVARLRDQLRKLEIETEAQILFRYEREIESRETDFDPLEMDRYSQLQQLSRSLMESVADLNSLQNLLENITRESETLLLQQARVNTELQEGLMHTRMVPFLGLAPRMRRIVRQTCQELGKKAELELSGAEGELDRTVIDRIIAPIEHMLRNALSHGIESPDERRGAGKSETGTIRITFGRESSDVVLRILDDGAGVNLARVREKAIERGLMQADAHLSDNEVLQFILETGFSTAKQVSQVAGRGVGMDVVNSEVRQLGGSLHIDSREGAGTTFTIRLPFTLAINQSLLVEVNDNTYAIPLSSIQGIVRVERDQLLKHYADPDLKLEYGGTDYEVRYLGELLGTRKPALNASQARVPMLLAKAGDHVMALQVDGLLGSREIVVKSVGPQISTVRGISGATILGDGRVVMILDVAALLRGGISPLSRVEELVHRATRSDKITVMVVDDSITVRKVTGRLLERSGMRVVTAKDGVDAVAKLNDVIPDIMLLDIEMPRMDGFELATHVRNEPELKHIPIIMITSRTGDKHRQRAMEIGVDRYLGKPFQEGDLLDNINALMGRSTLNG